MWVHFIGVGGTGMGALAAILKDKGYEVTGSDGPLYPPMSNFIKNKEIAYKPEFSASNLIGSTWGLKQSHPDIVVVGNIVSKGHVEAVKLDELMAKHEIKRFHFPQALYEFGIKGNESFVVAGTHGKTSTTSVMAWAFESLNKKPGFFIGGIPKNFGQGYRLTSEGVFCIEGDEYDSAYWDKVSKFLHYHPDWVLCTGLEYDHVDIFADEKAILDSFVELAKKTKKGWVLVEDSSSPNMQLNQQLAQEIVNLNKKIFRYGFGIENDFYLKKISVELQGDRNIMCLDIGSKDFGAAVVKTPFVGEHNALNTLGVIANLCVSGHAKSVEDFRESFLDFKGIKRRQDIVFENDEWILIDDFAHHPTAIEKTIEAIRLKFPNHKLAAFFEPRSASSGRNVFFDLYLKAFDKAHSVFLSPCTKTNIPEAERLDVGGLCEKLTKRKDSCVEQVNTSKDVQELSAAFHSWRKSLDAPAIALVMSNGSFNGLYDILLKET